MFEKAIPIFARHYRVIAMDTIGYGESDKPTRQMEIPEYAESVADFMDVLEIDKASVVGHHTGGGIAVELAASYPQRVMRLVINGAPWWEPEDRNQKLEWAPPLVIEND